MILHSQKFIRGRKLIMMLPLLATPFLTMIFWALGGGKGTVAHTRTTDTYIFLTEKDSNRQEYFAISADRIETLNLHACYDQHGQEVGHYNAADYHFDNSESDAKINCLEAIAEKFGIDISPLDIVEDGEGYVVEHEDGEEIQRIEEINVFVNEWLKENQNITTVEGFTYWDGHNWQTIITDDGDYPGIATHDVVDDEQLIAELNKAIEDREFVKEDFGKKIHEANGYTIISSLYASDWEAYCLVSDETEQD